MTKGQQNNVSLLQIVNGTTIKTGKKELTRFQAFKQFFIPRLAHQERLLIDFEEATVRQVDAEGEKLIQEAAKIAAETNLTKQQEYLIFCEALDKTFQDEDPQNILTLKMAKLLETNPDLSKQFDKVQEIMNSLHRNKACRIQIQTGMESDS